jgi:hypothetical protein
MGNADQVETTKDIKERMAEHAKAFSMHDVLRMIKAFNAAAMDTRGGWQPSLNLELALAEALEKPSEAPVAGGEEKPLPPASLANNAAVAPAKAGKATSAAQSAAPPPKAEAGKKTEIEAPAIGLPDVAKAWRDIRSIVKPDHPGIEALLNSCKPLEVRGNELYLGFQSETVRALMDIPEKVEVARKAIADVLGVELSIRCVVTNARGQLPPDVNPDGMVATALQNGGEIVDVHD